jgi:hypothetical protein
MNRSDLKRNSNKISNTQKIKDENHDFLYLAAKVKNGDFITSYAAAQNYCNTNGIEDKNEFKRIKSNIQRKIDKYDTDINESWKYLIDDDNNNNNDDDDDDENNNNISDKELMQKACTYAFNLYHKPNNKLSSRKIDSMTKDKYGIGPSYNTISNSTNPNDLAEYIYLKTPGKTCSYPIKAFVSVKNSVLYCRTHHILCNKAYLFNILPSHLQNIHIKYYKFSLNILLLI